MRGRLLPFTTEDIDNDVDLAFLKSMGDGERSYRMKSGEYIDVNWKYTRSKGRCYVAFFRGEKEIHPGTRRYSELFRELYLECVAWKLSRA